MMTPNLLCRTLGRISPSSFTNDVNRQVRCFFRYLRVAFNQVDLHRLQQVGPDRLCAEWIVKNGGAVKFTDSQQTTNDYSVLQTRTFSPSSRLQVVDATDSSIMELGFDHFKGCKAIERIILHRCQHLENEALEKLKYVKNSLKELQVTECKNIEDDGLLSLKQLNRLKTLTVYGFMYVKNFDGIIKQLQQHLPQCQIITNSQK